MNIAEIREKYPQYGDMTDEALGKALHAKFYSDMPYDQFAVKVGLPSKTVPGSEPAPAKPKDTRSLPKRFDDAMKGYDEALMSMLTAATGGLLGRVGGTLGGLAANVTSGKYGTQEGAQMAGEVASEAQQRFTYEPKTEEGREALATIGKLFQESKLEGVGPMALPAGTAATTGAEAAAVGPVRAAVGHAARVVKQTGRDAVQGARDLDLISTPAEMAGVGAADTAQAAMRRTRAESLPVPIKLTKGQAERTFEQQQFEREAEKNARIGEPLRQRRIENNEKILQNMDAWFDQTGAEAGSLRATGQIVTDAVVAKSHKAKAEINAAYKQAREAGDMREKVDAAPLRQYLADNQAEAINAPVLASVEKKLGYLLDKDGTISINDLEEVRKMVGKLSGKDATNAVFGKEVKNLIDSMTEGRGGDLYKRARSLRHRYAQEFEDHAVVEKLLSFKPGTKDRAVAYEDVFDHSLLKGSLDDVRVIRKTLQTAGDQGAQAWRELQGATIRHIKDEITKNVQIDEAGNRVLSPAKLDRLVTELDKDGKLDFIFGKQGAQQIRDVNGIAQDAFTAPPGAVNHSNTASILTALLDKVAVKATGVPFVGSAANFAAREVREAGDRKRVREALK